MNSITVYVPLLRVLAILAIGPSAIAQGTFQNLNLESCAPGTTYSAGVPASTALPDWTVAINSVQQADVGVNFFSTGAPYVSIIGPGGAFPPIDGNYSILLTATLESASISQTGQIPASDQSLLFEAQPGWSLAVSIAGQNVPFSAVGSGPNYTLYEANISAWAGQTEQLTFSAVPYDNQLNYWEIDDISFSPTSATPEPSALALMLMGGAAFAVRCWRAKRR